ncbi:MAG: hypothetical protein KIT11_05570 [Fimbriimonadaceae bacterium]|nr:hypothetical protein [Fimbriimonadaceae bacterium]QYK56639.1 MAG: hypothetical protein KF733_03950 [Fimbriimonadaceae bacterium]
MKKKVAAAPAWAASAEVARVARPLILSHHQDLAHARILYALCDRQETVRGATAWATASKLSGFQAWLACRAFFSVGLVPPEMSESPGDVFVMRVFRDFWNQADERLREAVVDHELCHFELTVDDEGEERYWIKPHDVEEFAAVLGRHGDYRGEASLLMSYVSSYERRTGQTKIDIEEQAVAPGQLPPPEYFRPMGGGVHR